MVYHSIKLKKGREISLQRFHPWVFSGAILTSTKNLEDGELVDVMSHDGTFLGTGHFQSGSSISVRIITFESCQIDQSFWIKSLIKARAYRKKIDLPNQYTNAYRLIHGEGDGLPGLIVDIYNNIAVVQCHSIGMFKHYESITVAIDKVLGECVDTVYVRVKDTLPDSVGSEVSDIFAKGSSEETMVTENGITFKINVVTGQKTGFFLDQRENRAIVGLYAGGKSVLNCFCYTGGFSLYALIGGATEVDSVDISQKAMDLVEENLVLNNLQGRHHSHCANVMQYLNDPNVKLYDMVIIDPPAFAKSLHKRHNAVQAYKRLNVLAMKKVKPGGLLFTFSCSQVVSTQLFYDTIVAAGIEAGRNIRVIRSLSQGPDHPINLFHPEGHYLKGLVLYLE